MKASGPTNNPRKKRGNGLGFGGEPGGLVNDVKKMTMFFCLAMVMVVDVVEVISSPNPDVVCFFSCSRNFYSC